MFAVGGTWKHTSYSVMLFLDFPVLFLSIHTFEEWRMWVNLLFSLPVVPNGLFVLLSLSGFPPEGRTNPPNSQLAALFFSVPDETLDFFQMVGISSLRELLLRVPTAKLRVRAPLCYSSFLCLGEVSGFSLWAASFHPCRIGLLGDCEY